MSQEIKKLRYVIAVCQGRQLEVCELGSGLSAASGTGGMVWIITPLKVMTGHIQKDLRTSSLLQIQS